MSEGRAENVDMLKRGLMRVQRLTGADCNPGLGRHPRRFRTVCKARRGEGESQCAQGLEAVQVRARATYNSAPLVAATVRPDLSPISACPNQFARVSAVASR